MPGWNEQPRSPFFLPHSSEIQFAVGTMGANEGGHFQRSAVTWPAPSSSVGSKPQAGLFDLSRRIQLKVHLSLAERSQNEIAQRQKCSSAHTRPLVPLFEWVRAQGAGKHRPLRFVFPAITAPRRREKKIYIWRIFPASLGSALFCFDLVKQHAAAAKWFMGGNFLLTAWIYKSEFVLVAPWFSTKLLRFQRPHSL